MLMRAVFASAMLIGLAGTAQADIKVIYPPYSYEPPIKLCGYILGGSHGCGCHQGYGARHRHHDMAGAAAMVPGDAHAKTARVAMILPPPLGE